MARMASMKKDQGDFNQLRHHRNRNLGSCVSWEYYQPVPYFFTREGAQLNMVGHYRGRSAFLVSNGPSIASGKYDLSLLKLPGVITYGVNNGPKTIRPNFWSCVDDPKRFLKSIWLDPTITKFVPHAHAEKPLFDNEKWQDLEVITSNGSPRKVLVGDCPNVVYFHRNSKFMADRFLYEDTINWGNHADYGGGRSVMLPIVRILFLLGFRKVFLLGADFRMSETYTYHFDEQRSKGAVKGNLATYDRMKNDYFPALKPFFDAEGFQIFNCARPEDSDLKVFPFKPYEEAIQECIAPLGDLTNERTWGLYSKPEERQKWKDDPDVSQKAHLAALNLNRNMAVTAVDGLVAGKIVPPVNDEELVACDEPVKKATPMPAIVNKPAPLAPKAMIKAPPRFPVEQLYPEKQANLIPNAVPVNMGVDKQIVVRNMPCGHVASRGSSRPSTQPKPTNTQQGYITLPDNGM